MSASYRAYMYLRVLARAFVLDLRTAIQVKTMVAVHLYGCSQIQDGIFEVTNTMILL